MSWTTDLQMILVKQQQQQDREGTWLCVSEVFWLEGVVLFFLLSCLCFFYDVKNTTGRTRSHSQRGWHWLELRSRLNGMNIVKESHSYFCRHPNMWSKDKVVQIEWTGVWPQCQWKIKKSRCCKIRLWVKSFDFWINISHIKAQTFLCKILLATI